MAAEKKHSLDAPDETSHKAKRPRSIIDTDREEPKDTVNEEASFGLFNEDDYDDDDIDDDIDDASDVCDDGPQKSDEFKIKSTMTSAASSSSSSSSPKEPKINIQDNRYNPRNQLKSLVINEESIGRGTGWSQVEAQLPNTQCVRDCGGAGDCGPLVAIYSLFGSKSSGEAEKFVPYIRHLVATVMEQPRLLMLAIPHISHLELYQRNTIKQFNLDHPRAVVSNWKDLCDAFAHPERRVYWTNEQFQLISSLFGVTITIAMASWIEPLGYFSEIQVMEPCNHRELADFVFPSLASFHVTPPKLILKSFWVGCLSPCHYKAVGLGYQDKHYPMHTVWDNDVPRFAAGRSAWSIKEADAPAGSSSTAAPVSLSSSSSSPIVARVTPPAVSHGRLDVWETAQTIHGYSRDRIVAMQQSELGWGIVNPTDIQLEGFMKIVQPKLLYRSYQAACEIITPSPAVGPPLAVPKLQQQPPPFDLATDFDSYQEFKPMNLWGTPFVVYHIAGDGDLSERLVRRLKRIAEVSLDVSTFAIFGESGNVRVLPASLRHLIQKESADRSNWTEFRFLSRNIRAQAKNDWFAKNTAAGSAPILSKAFKLFRGHIKSADQIAWVLVTREPKQELKKQINAIINQALGCNLSKLNSLPFESKRVKDTTDQKPKGKSSSAQPSPAKPKSESDGKEKKKEEAEIYRPNQRYNGDKLYQEVCKNLKARGQQLSDFTDFKFAIFVPSRTSLVEQTKKRLNDLNLKTRANNVLPLYELDSVGKARKSGENPAITKFRKDITINPKILFILVQDECHWGHTATGAVKLFLYQDLLFPADDQNNPTAFHNTVHICVSATPENHYVKQLEAAQLCQWRQVYNTHRDEEPLYYFGEITVREEITNDASVQFKETHQQVNQLITTLKAQTGSEFSVSTQLVASMSVIIDYAQTFATMIGLPMGIDCTRDSRVTRNVLETLLTVDKDGRGSMLVVRFPAESFAQTLVYAMRTLRDAAGLQDRFAVFSDCGERTLWDELEPHFQDRLRTWHPKKEWKECVYEDLQGLPCILALVDKGRFGDTFPKSMMSFDLRARYLADKQMVRSTFIQDAGRVFRYASPRSPLPKLLLGPAAYEQFKNIHWYRPDGKLTFVQHKGEKRPARALRRQLWALLADYKEELIGEEQRKVVSDNFVSTKKSLLRETPTNILDAAASRMIIFTAYPQIGKTASFMYVFDMLTKYYAKDKWILLVSYQSQPIHRVQLSWDDKELNDQSQREKIKMRVLQSLGQPDDVNYSWMVESAEKSDDKTSVPFDYASQLTEHAILKVDPILATVERYEAKHGGWVLQKEWDKTTAAELQDRVLNTDEFEKYHSQYSAYREKWREQWKNKPYKQSYEIMIKLIEDSIFEDTVLTIADIGCGPDAAISSHFAANRSDRIKRIDSFDLKACPPHVQSVNGAAMTEQKNDTYNIVIFSLSLFNRSWQQMLSEGVRILKPTFWLFILVPRSFFKGIAAEQVIAEQFLNQFGFISHSFESQNALVDPDKFTLIIGQKPKSYTGLTPDAWAKVRWIA